MTHEQYKIYQELLELIARYDWAVEGFPAPANIYLNRESAVAIRNGLVKLATELTRA